MVVACHSCGSQGLRFSKCSPLATFTATRPCAPARLWSSIFGTNTYILAVGQASNLSTSTFQTCPLVGIYRSQLQIPERVHRARKRQNLQKSTTSSVFIHRNFLGPLKSLTSLLIPALIGVSPQGRASVVQVYSKKSGVVSELQMEGTEVITPRKSLQTSESAPPATLQGKIVETAEKTKPQKEKKKSGKEEGAEVEVEEGASTSNTHNRGDLSTITVGGLSLQGVSVGGQETCIIIPSMKIAFDIGRCPQRAVFQENVLISHAHMDHIGGICLQAASRGLFSLKPPRVIVPKVIAPAVENLFNAFRALDNAELDHKLLGLEVGEELPLTGELFVKPFQTYHVVPSQGYVVYSRRQKLKPEYVGLPGKEIGRLKKSGVEITNMEEVPEVAFTGDTTAEFITDPANADVLRAKLLIMEMTFIDDSSTVEHARKWGHTHLDEVVPLAHMFQNEAILFIHFSARYRRKDILEALEGLPPGFREKVTPLLERF